jgi:hypothetical protein
MGQDKTQGKKEEIRTDVGSSSQKQQNQTVQFSKLEHLVSPRSAWRGVMVLQLDLRVGALTDAKNNGTQGTRGF